jgi:hypothetical protein
MGAHPNISMDRFPKQGSTGQRVKVCFDRDTSKQIGGRMVRDDMEEPWLTVIRLDDGRIVLDSECQFAFGEPSRTTRWLTDLDAD